VEPKFSGDPTTVTTDYNKKKFTENFEQLKENLKPYWKLK